MKLRADRHLYDDNSFVINYMFFGKENIRRVNFLRIVGKVDKICFQFFNGSRFNTGYSSIISNTEKDITSVSIKKGAHSFHEVTRQLLYSFLELTVQPFTACYVLSYLFTRHFIAPQLIDN